MRMSINDVRNLGELQSLTKWNLEFITFPKGVASPPTKEELNSRCVNITLPKATTNDALVNMRGHTIEMPGKLTFERRLTLTFAETVDSKVAQFIRDWRTAVQTDVAGVTGNKVDVECTIKIERLDTKDNPIWEYVLYGCFYKDATLPQLLEESDDMFRTELVISYDYFKEGLPGTATESVV